MRGQILGVDARTGEAQVAGDDGRRYRFTRDDWAHRGEPAVGMAIDFQAEEGRALSVFPVPGASATAVSQPRSAPVTDRNKWVAAVLAFFIGTLGIHRFYLGRTGSAIVMLVLSCTIFGLLVTAPWALIDAIRYLVMSDREFAIRYAREDERVA